jgi:hypothetical protein
VLADRGRERAGVVQRGRPPGFNLEDPPSTSAVRFWMRSRVGVLDRRFPGYDRSRDIPGSTASAALGHPGPGRRPTPSPSHRSTR